MSAVTIELEALERLVERAVTRALTRQAAPSSDRWLTPNEAALQYRKRRAYVVALCESDQLKARREPCRGGRMGWKIDPTSAKAILGASTLFVTSAR